MCLGVIYGLSDTQMINTMKKEGSKFIKELGLELAWQLTYRESFISEDMMNNSIIFELTRDGVAEKILCPDWCQYNGEFSNETLENRLEKVKQFIRLVLQYSTKVDLYIGESGGSNEDYEHCSVSISDIVKFLLKIYRIKGDVPNVCLHINK